MKFTFLIWWYLPETNRATDVSVAPVLALKNSKMFGGWIEKPLMRGLRFVHLHSNGLPVLLLYLLEIA